MSDFSVFCCFINVQGIVPQKDKNYVICLSILSWCFMFTPSFTQVVLNLSEFLSSAERKCYFEEQGKPNSLLILGDFHIFPTIKDNVDQQLFGFPHSSKYHILC